MAMKISAGKLRWALPLLVLSAASPAWAAGTAEQQPGLLDFDIGAAVWVLISFTLVLIILYKSAWKNVLASLKGREERIGGNIRHAEEANARAEATLKQYAAQLAGGEEQVRLMLQKASVEAEKIASNIRAQAQAEGEAEREKTRKEIESARRDAVRQVYEQTADLATTIASKIIGRNLNPADQQDLVSQTLGQLESMGQR